MEGIIVDVALITVIVLSAVFAAKKGFLEALLGILVSVGSLIAAKVLSTPASQIIYDGFVREPVINKVQSMLPANLTSGDPQAILNGLYEQLPDGVTALATQYGFLPESLPAVENAATFFDMQNLETAYIQPFCLKVLSILAMVVIFYILFVVLRMVVRLISRRFHRGKKRPVDRFLGAALGVIRAAIPVLVLTILLNFAADYNLNDSLTTAVENSKVCAYAQTFTDNLTDRLFQSEQTETTNP